jgi:hypothetical protein
MEKPVIIERSLLKWATQSSFVMGGGGFTEDGAKVWVQLVARRDMCALSSRVVKALMKATAVSWRVCSVIVVVG